MIVLIILQNKLWLVAIVLVLVLVVKVVMLEYKVPVGPIVGVIAIAPLDANKHTTTDTRTITNI